jgi:hypothetical protein
MTRANVDTNKTATRINPGHGKSWLGEMCAAAQNDNIYVVHFAVRK